MSSCRVHTIAATNELRPPDGIPQEGPARELVPEERLLCYAERDKVVGDYLGGVDDLRRFDRHAVASGSAMRLGALAGALGVAGLALLYTGLAAGRMHTVAPLAAVVGATVPAVWGLATGERPSMVALAGVVLAISAVAIATRSAEPSELPSADLRRPPLGVPLAVLAGVAFGLIAVVLADVPTRDGLWPVVAWRAISLPIAALACIAWRRHLRFD